MCIRDSSSPGYVGFDTSVTLNQYKNYWLDAIRNYLKYFLYFMIPASLLIITYIKHWKILLREAIIACLLYTSGILSGMQRKIDGTWYFLHEIRESEQNRTRPAEGKMRRRKGTEGAFCRIPDAPVQQVV